MGEVIPSGQLDGSELLMSMQFFLHAVRAGTPQDDFAWGKSFNLIIIQY